MRTTVVLSRPTKISGQPTGVGLGIFCSEKKTCPLKCPIDFRCSSALWLVTRSHANTPVCHLVFRLLRGDWVGLGSAVGNALYDASGRRTRRRGPTRRERTTRRTVSYKASGPDASGMYDASYSVVQGVVQHQHRTTQYDIVRPPSPSRRVNDGSGPSWGKGAFGPLPKYWHFASTTCRQCLQLAGRVYLWCTVSTDPRPPSPCAECCLIEGGGQSVA